MENPIASLVPLNVGESDVCRLCTKIREYYLNIFVSNEVFKMSIGMAIQDLLVLEVAKGDSLPETVCCSCCTKLMEFRDFKEMCVNSARELLGMHAPMEAVTCPVKVEFLDDELSDEGERNKWNEFVEDQGSAHSNEAYEAEEMPRRCVPDRKRNYLSTKFGGMITVVYYRKVDRSRPEWLKNIPRKDWNPSSVAVYYVKHFDAEYILRYATKSNAITVFRSLPVFLKIVQPLENTN